MRKSGTNNGFEKLYNYDWFENQDVNIKKMLRYDICIYNSVYWYALYMQFQFVTLYTFQSKPYIIYIIQVSISCTVSNFWIFSSITSFLHVHSQRNHFSKTRSLSLLLFAWWKFIFTFIVVIRVLAQNQWEKLCTFIRLQQRVRP